MKLPNYIREDIRKACTAYDRATKYNNRIVKYLGKKLELENEDLPTSIQDVLVDCIETGTSDFILAIELLEEYMTDELYLIREKDNK